ncbi:MAG: FtsQ-type POTRA domain-containing protein, partial [Firmicutes bacterium]|nr:FtsQ-type POTRA domain-containing protein [Bacillota bacterium]
MRLTRVILALFLVFSGYVLFRSPLFEIRRVDVQGNSAVPRAEIEDSAAVPLGRNIFEVDLRLVRERLLGIPMLKDAEVYRSLPSTVVIRVVERVPVALVPVAGGFAEVDGDGVFLRRGSVGASGLPVLTGVRVAAAQLGRPIEGSGLAEGLSVLRGLGPALAVELSEIHVGREVLLYTLDGIEVRLGPAENLEAKARVLPGLLVALRSGGKRILY